MMAFIQGQYSSMLPAGGMFGYVMDGEASEAWNGIANQIESQRAPLKLSSGSRLIQSKLPNVLDKALDGSQLGETDHDLATHHLRLFHLLLPVRSSRDVMTRP
jgi:hypothetical protein